MTRRVRGRVKVIRPVKRERPFEPVPETERLEVPPELARLIGNWLLWSGGGAPIGMWPHGEMYSTLGQMVGVGDSRTGPSVPVISVDGERTERAIKALPGDLRQAVFAWWCWGGSLRSRARRARMREARLLELVKAAHVRLEIVLLGGPGTGHSATRARFS